ncbi:hypothetical protein Acor_15850 [Acrocarpospora corrugata]|uniref:Methylamine utilisation protein MauE domain-containing protein n=1 Tax=Acrocarpospora corrugata TaxID=35763 RepID=A0A5M3VV15_9ACTN|nr:MauE/DoxX family redox-associated membrane protein [Acrocarpospora corrugata]GER99521.1 hypothetical protein Acor_15850 [Acrocarpospora corrugata]
MILIADVALAGAVLLVVAGARHLARAGAVTRVIREHGLLPGWVVRCAVPVGPLLGLAVLAGWAVGADFRYVWAAAAAWQAALAGYLAILLRVRGRVPCGCLDAETRVSPLKIAVGVLWSVASAAMAGGALTPPPDVLARLLHLPLAGFVALLAVVAEKAADLVGTSRDRGR